jgi:hypothetical protein
MMKVNKARLRLFYKMAMALIVLAALTSCAKDRFNNGFAAIENTIKAHDMMKTWESPCSDNAILSSSK